MPRYYVTLPIAGYVSVEVDVNSESEAIDAAMMSEISTDDIIEWDTYKELVRGNVCSVPFSRAEVELIEEDDE